MCPSTGAADEVEAKLSAHGRWLLETVFANDAAAKTRAYVGELRAKDGEAPVARLPRRC